MKRLIGTKRRKIVAVIAALSLVAAATGMAFYLAQGNGSASGGVAGSSPVGISVNGAINSAPIYPGQSRPVAITITNSASHGNISDVGTVTGVVANDGTDVLGAPGCSKDWFTFAPVTISPGVELAQGASDSTQSGTLVFVESHTDQSACSNASLYINLSLNGG